jgi:hypothetical protein
MPDLANAAVPIFAMQRILIAARHLPTCVPNPVAFLCSEAGGYIDGAWFRIDGGHTEALF